MERSAVFDALKKRGAAKAVVSFSGGHDEGGCDSIELFTEAGAKIAALEEYYEGEELTTDDEALSQGLCAPVYDKYSSFAGEYSVNGTVTWDVTARTCKMTGEESVETYDSFEDELEDA